MRVNYLAKGAFVALKSCFFVGCLASMASSYLSARVITNKCYDKQEVYGTSTTIHIGSPVEPSIAVNPKDSNHIVCTWQQDRIDNGGAIEAGIAYSTDGGKHWCRSTVPFQICNGGITQRMSDVWLSFSKDGSRVYLCGFAINATTEPHTKKQQGIVVSISKDGGITWSIPQYLTSSISSLDEPTGQFPFFDKCSITADPNEAPFAYAVWDRFPQTVSFHSTSQISRTKNGGRTWSRPQLVYDPFRDLNVHHESNGIENDCNTINNIVVVLPKADPDDELWKNDHFGNKENKKHRFSGDLLNFMVRQYAKPGVTDDQYVNDSFPYQYTNFDIAVVRSKDHGKTWQKYATVISPFVDNYIFTGGYTYNDGKITGGVGTRLREGDSIPSYNVNPKNGFLYVVWQTGQFRADQLAQIALSTSRDGGRTWSSPVQVSRTPVNSLNAQAYTPFVSVTKDGQVGILYFDFRKDNPADVKHTKVNAWLAIYQEVKDKDGGSTGAGLDFVKEIRLSEDSYIAQNGPTTTQGVMVNGDYSFLTAQGSDFYAIYMKTCHGPFREPIPFLKDPANNASIFLDVNHRQSPYVSIVKNFGNKKNPKLLLTKKVD